MKEKKSMSSKNGVIYILTNPSFPEYVKIGYATSIEQRLKQLNRSETIPFAFRVYATYETSKALTDKKLHELIDNLNPELRAIETFDGKQRTKEFYNMKPEQAYQILECIATISGTKDKLKRMKPEGHEILDEEIAEENRKASRRPPFKFSMVGLKPGDEIIYKDGEIKATVVDDSKILFHGETVSLSRAVSLIYGDVEWEHSYCGPEYWYYKGRKLSELRSEEENNQFKPIIID